MNKINAFLYVILRDFVVMNSRNAFLFMLTVISIEKDFFLIFPRILFVSIAPSTTQFMCKYLLLCLKKLFVFTYKAFLIMNHGKNFKLYFD